MSENPEKTCFFLTKWVFILPIVFFWGSKSKKKSPRVFGPKYEVFRGKVTTWFQNLLSCNSIFVENLHFGSFFIIRSKKSCLEWQTRFFLWKTDFSQKSWKSSFFEAQKIDFFGTFRFLFFQLQLFPDPTVKKQSGYETPQIWCFLEKSGHMVLKPPFL